MKLFLSVLFLGFSLVNCASLGDLQAKAEYVQCQAKVAKGLKAGKKLADLPKCVKPGEQVEEAVAH